MALSSSSLMVGAAVSTLGLAVAPLLTCLLTAVLFTALALPTGALAVTRTGRHRAEQDAASPWRPVDLARIARDLELARELLVVGAATTGLLLVVLTPVAVSLRPFGFLVPGIGGLLLVLRSRHHRATVDVVCMGVSGLLGVVATAGESVLWPGSSWRLPGGVLVALGGALAVLASLREGTGGGVRRGRLCHALETVALGALVPALLLVVGSSLAMS
jgi:hypothetical protein